MDQKPHKNILNQRFLDVKKKLEPSKSYLIFENDAGKTDDSLLSETLQVYAYLETQQLEWQTFIDREQKSEYLIIQTEPGNEDDILGRLMACQLPEDMVCYVYKAGS